jgi:hypothetical protein
MVAHLDGVRPIGYRNMDVASADTLLRGYEPEVPCNPLVAVGFRHRLPLTDDRWDTDSQDSATHFPRRHIGGLSTLGEMVAQLGHRFEHRSGGFDLARRQLEIEFESERPGDMLDRGAFHERFAGGLLHEKELFLHTECRNLTIRSRHGAPPNLGRHR